MPGDCNLCNKKNVKTCCGTCQSVFYCDRQCQLKDWINHKIECEKKQHTNKSKSDETYHFNDTLPVFDTYLIRIQESKLYSGYGVIANNNISKGTIIHCEKPLMSLPNCIEKQYIKFYISQQYQILSQTQKHIYQSLSKSTVTGDEEDILLSIWNNNVIQLKQRKSSGIFPIISRINHCCKANAHWIWNETCNHLRLITLSDIAKSTEITVNYLGMDVFDTKTRKSKLKHRWNDTFKCKCDWCYNKQISTQMDIVINKYRLLDKSLELLLLQPMKGYKASLKLVQIVAEQFNTNPMLLYQHSLDTAQFALGLRKWNEALFYLQNAFEQKRIAQGQDIVMDKSFMEKVNLLPDKWMTQFYLKYPEL